MKHSSLYEVNILMEHLSFLLIYVQEDRERMVVRRFKFEDPRMEQIQELEVYINVFMMISLLLPLEVNSDGSRFHFLAE